MAPTNTKSLPSWGSRPTETKNSTAATQLVQTLTGAGVLLLGLTDAGLGPRVRLVRAPA